MADAASSQDEAEGHVQPPSCAVRSEEHTSELQSHSDLVCRLLLEKKKPHRTRAGTLMSSARRPSILMHRCSPPGRSARALAQRRDWCAHVIVGAANDGGQLLSALL